MFINKPQATKKTQKNKKKSQSRNKIKKTYHKEQQIRIPKLPAHQSSTFSLLSNHNISQSSLVSQQRHKKSLAKCSKHQQSVNVQSKSKGKLKKKNKKSVCRKGSPQIKSRKQNKDQIYERIALGEYNSKTNSEINFSSNGSSRFNKNKKKLRIQCSDDYILNQYITNSLLHQSQYRRNEAAIKIQKVFRGYMTRKMLQNFIQKQQAKLQQLSYKLKKSALASKQNHSKKCSPIKLTSPERIALMNMSSDLLFEEEINQFQVGMDDRKLKNRIDHQALQQQSSIQAQYQNGDSLSKYLPEDMNFNEIEDQHELMKSVHQYHDNKVKQEEKQKQDGLQEQQNFQYKTTTQKIQEPMATDFSQKIAEFQNYSQSALNKDSDDQPYPNSINTFISDSMQLKINQLNMPKKQPTLNQSIKSKQKQYIAILKKQQQEKWAKIIEMLNEHMIRSANHSQDADHFMRNVLEYSKKNKEELEGLQYLSSGKKYIRRENKKMIEEIEEIEENENNNNMVHVLKKQSNRIQKIRKNEDMPLIIRKTIKQSSPCNILQKTQQLKKYFHKNITPYPIEQMLQIRQKALEKRQKQMVNKLNQDLQKSSISHELFLQRLASMQTKFEKQKQIITKTKMEIYLGNQAVNKLVQDSFMDARYLGYKIPFSQSMKDIKRNSALWVKEVIVDQLKSYNKSGGKVMLNKIQEENLQPEPKKSKFKSDSTQLKQEDESHLTIKQSQSQSIDYLNQAGQQDLSYNEGAVQNKHYKLDTSKNFEQSFQQSDEDSDLIDTASKFRKVNPISRLLSNKDHSPLFQKQRNQLESDLISKISITRHLNTPQDNIFQQLKKYELASRQNKNSYHLIPPKSQVFNVSFESDDDDDDEEQDEIIFDQKMDPAINSVTEEQITKLMWEFVGELFENGHMWRKLHRPSNHTQAKLTENQRKIFLQLLYTNIPDYQDLTRKLNQKMAPSKLQLLKYMRVTLEDESEQYQQQSQFEEIGKYQLIFPPEMCLQTIQQYLQQKVNTQGNQYSQEEQKKKIEDMLKDKVSRNCIEKVLERENFRVFSDNQRKDLRVQISKIQFHCIFDALNETILRLHSKTIGYSGIGLNEISLLFYTDQEQNNKIQTPQQIQKILTKTKQLVQNLVVDKKSDEALILQSFDETIKNDGLWIQYSDEALSFAMELVFMMEDELFVEESDIIINLLKKGKKDNLF